MQAIVMPDGTVSLGSVRQTENRRRQIKRALLMVIFMVSLMFGAGSANAFPNNPCLPAVSRGTARGVSLAQLFLLLLPALARPIV
jgi:hypothetical protein